MKATRPARQCRTTLAIILAALVAGSLLAACGSGSTSVAGNIDSGGGTLNVASSVPSGSLDPAKANPGTDPVYLDPLYAPLIEQQPNGSLKGVLASSWKYIGPNHEHFQITLRPHLKFSNGTPLDASAVVASIKHFAAGGQGAWIKACPTISAVSSIVVELKCTSPQPVLATVFTQALIGGDIVAPTSLAHPATLGTDPIGAGEYKLDAADTIAGSTYTYVRNPYYFDPSAIHWSKIVVKFLASPTSAIDAMRSGQLDAYFATAPQALTAAHESGLDTEVAPGPFFGVNLADRATRPGNPIGNLMVRQALEYAVDRPAIVKSLVGTEGSPTDQVATPNQATSWNPSVNDYYPYDPAKAKQLLTQAGYPHGFTVNVEDQPINSQVTQAVIGYWNKIGVNAKVTTDPTISGWIHGVLSRKFPVVGYSYGGLPMYLEATNWFEPIRNPFNPFASTDSTISGQLQRAAAASAGQQTTDYQQAQALGVKKAWYVGVDYQEAGFITTNKIELRAGTRFPPSIVYASPRP